MSDPFDFSYPMIDPFDPFSRAAGGNMAETEVPIQLNRRARRAAAALARRAKRLAVRP